MQLSVRSSRIVRECFVYPFFQLDFYTPVIFSKRLNILLMLCKLCLQTPNEMLRKWLITFYEREKPFNDGKLIIDDLFDVFRLFSLNPTLVSD